ncbi:uncharacterized protein HHUB_2938 [Halobacterium hubeiense]|uniref:Archaeal Type IV pilin N-terminal domain-containing protein n=1 Tax=Halobacterium hubeiense TaxID=1407499 RepID=A0A0U5H4R1_9EURY|nr:uncharacterized protein HHUB_2938 [Halobacterium hubeiense]
MGAVLLVAVVVSVSAVGGTVVLDRVDSGADAPTVDLDGRLTAEAGGVALSLTNMGGATVPYRDLSVVVQAGGASDRVATESVGSERSLAPGETWRPSLAVDASAGDVVSVYAVHEPSGELLFEDERRVASDNDALSASLSVDSAAIETPGSTTLTATANHSGGESATFEWAVVDGGAYASLSANTGDRVTLAASSVTTTQTVTVRVTAAAGDQSTTRTVDVTLTPAPDTDAPAVTVLASSRSPESMLVAVSSDERLASLTVGVDGPDDETLALTDFSRRGDGPGFVYERALDDVAAGTYEVTVERAADDAGNDGAGSRDFVDVEAADEDENEEADDGEWFREWFRDWLDDWAGGWFDWESNTWRDWFDDGG